MIKITKTKKSNTGRIISNCVAYRLGHPLPENTIQKQSFKGALRI